MTARRPKRSRRRLGTRGLRVLRRELGSRRSLSARVEIIAVGPTGRRTTFTHSYTLTR